MTENMPVTVCALGGFGEIGLNCLTMFTPDDGIVIDCGLMFPDDSLFGIDIVIPKFDHILANKEKLQGIILTHGHEDHIGAIPWLLRHLETTIYGSRFTLGLVERKLEEHNLLNKAKLEVVDAGDTLTLGNFKLTFINACHSFIHSFALGIETPAGRIVHTGDFKLDPDPLGGVFTDMDAIRRFSEPGVRLLLSDSTNVEREGWSLPEIEIKNAFSDIFKNAPGRILVTLFSSHIQRIQEVFDLAKQYGRKVAVAGRSLILNIELARSLGDLQVPEGLLVRTEDVGKMKNKEVVQLVTGSQGEPLSALSRLATGEHPHLRAHPGDTVIMSSRVIPGNTKSINRLINLLYKQGAEVLYEQVQAIHASGHAHREELKDMLETVKPKFFIPVHGEYRHLVKHCQLAVECGVAEERAIVLENGNPITFKGTSVCFEESIPVGHIYVDGKGVGDVGQSVLKERQLLAGDGIVIVLLLISEKTDEIILGPEIISRGFIFEQKYNHIIEDAQCIIQDIFDNISKRSPEKIADRIRSSLRRFFRKTIERDPIVIPMVLAI